MRWSVPLILTGCSDFNLNEQPEVNHATPDIEVSDTELYFGLVDVGESAGQTLSISNVGSAALTILNVPIQNEVGGTFIMTTGGFPVVLESGASMDLMIVYTADTSADVGLINVLSNDPQDPDIPVSLRGGYEGPKLKVEPPAFNFEEELIYCEAQQEFVLSNIGSEKLDLYEIWMKNDDFVITEPPTAWSLEPGQRTRLEVEFKPAVAALFEDSLIIDSNDPVGETSVPLYGVGGGDGACQLLDLSFQVKYEIADVAFLIDTTNPRFTYLMEALMASEFGDIVDELSKEMEDITFGVAFYQDYYKSPYGDDQEFPFSLRAQQTKNVSRVQAALTDLVDGSWGSDEPASTMEALYQAMAGLGYDQNCDRGYDEDEDVLPFISSSTDVFRGNSNDTRSSAAGDGDLGGMGFRDGALPIVIFVTDSSLRDPDSGDPSPGGCDDAGSSDVERARSALGARIIGVSMNASNYSDVAKISDVTFSWEYHSGTIKDSLIGAIEDIVKGTTFDEVWLEVSSDAYNQVDSVDPERWENVRTGSNVSFSLTVNSALVDEPRDDTYPVTVDVKGQLDGEEWLLTSHHFNVLIPISEPE